MIRLIDENVGKHYKKMIRNYRSFLTENFEFIVSLVKKGLEKFGNNFSYLDIGTHRGDLPLRLRKDCPKATILACDIFDTDIKEIDFRKASVTALPWENESVHITSCLNVLCYTERNVGISEINRILKRNGILITSEASQDFVTFIKKKYFGWNSFRQILRGGLENYRFSRYENRIMEQNCFYRLEDFTSFLEKNGFSILKVFYGQWNSLKYTEGKIPKARDWLIVAMKVN